MMSKLSHILDDSTLARTVFFLRIKSPFAFRYNLFYPLVCACLAMIMYLVLPVESGFWKDFAFAQKLGPLLSLLFPFYVASLAAVSTFSGSKEIDQVFPEDASGGIVTLSYRGRNGVSYPHRISQRHFLSLLFAYCSVLSVVLLFLTGLAPFVSAGLGSEQPFHVWLVSLISLSVHLFLFFQMIVLTLLAVYYLGDKIHRRQEPSGDEVILDTLNETEKAALKGRPPTQL